MSKIILNAIINEKKREIRERKLKVPLTALKQKIASFASLRDFKKAISGDRLSAIAEIKTKSPSYGIITKLDLKEIAQEYENSKNCKAISVLTDKKYFGGDISWLKLIKTKTTKPILRKDFILDEYQVYESRLYGADAILLIATILSKRKLYQLFKLAKRLGMACLVEVHSQKDIKKVPHQAEIYGINTRDLSGGFSTNLDLAKELIEYIPKDKIVVVESGLKTKRDIKFIKSLKRVNAVLIGTSILKSPHPGKALDRLF
jgi:indole-3-glycerol phosphate synthase